MSSDLLSSISFVGQTGQINNLTSRLLLRACQSNTTEASPPWWRLVVFVSPCGVCTARGLRVALFHQNQATSTSTTRRSPISGPGVLQRSLGTGAKLFFVRAIQVDWILG